jgi:glycosyltransferase involved in cell wall biosynthesis
MKLRGLLRRLAGIDGPLPGNVCAALLPEFIAAHSLAAVGQLRRLLPPGTPLLAVFHDAIAMRMPEFCAGATVQRMPAYVAALAEFDGVAAVSAASRAELLELWEKMGIRDVPPVAVVHPGVEPFGPATPRTPGVRPRFLCVSTLEPRKNHLALLDAAETLWAEGLDFELELVGMAHRENGARIVERVDGLRKKGRPLQWLGPVDDATLRGRYAACDFSIYCSLMEGYGLPVAESVACGRPCLCTTCGGLDEVSAGGGCLRLSSTDAAAMAKGMESLIRDKALAERLIGEAIARPVRSWADYARDIRDWARAAAPAPATPSGVA